MNAEDFWLELEYRICREIAGLAGDEFRGLWCDGFMDRQFELVDGRPSISGIAWMGIGGTHQEQWRFTLVLPVSVRVEEDIDWAGIYPSDGVSGWLSLDRKYRVMKMNPLAAHPVRSPASP